ncbi:MAG TPA: CCA tRNA nucleotidyltransferase [Bryobacteraceae bacterium]|nr:CCA tRNA nucleotidyltransferase [Bryobacteraceae bacterium]
MPGSALALEVVQFLRLRGHKAYLVGGCVRDRLLGGSPKDYDVATDASPAQVLTYYPKSDQVGANFGVVLISDGARNQVEVATFRSDDDYRDGRRPERVKFESDPRQDALRRDFTINALFEDPFSGEVLDYVGGQRDLEDRIIRAIGDPERRFREDHLRLLRAVRFAARLDFEIEPATFEAMRKLAPLAADVAAERTRVELVRILTEGHPRRGMELLDRTGLLVIVLPEVAALKGVEQPPEYHPEGDVWVHTLMMLDLLEHPSATLAMGVLLHDVGKPATFRIAERIRFDGHAEKGVEIAAGILERLRYSREDSEQILALIANHMRFKDIRQMRQSTLKRFLRLPEFAEHLELHRIDCMASHGGLDCWRFARKSMDTVPEAELRPPRLLTGRDLIDEGYKPGPAFGRALEEVETAQLEGTVRNKEEALAVARKTLEPETLESKSEP